MRASLLLLALLARAPFWETKPPAQWTEDELRELLTDSPWAQQATDSQGERVQVYLATARPIREAERELAGRSAPSEDASSGEYEEFIRENSARQIVLAVALSNIKALEDPADVRRMEENCFLKVGRKKHKITGYFPPGPGDPYLRLVFPRAVTPADTSLVFELYLPGTPKPYRLAEFRIKDLNYRGAPDY
jgi:hypothetical protein